MRVFVINAYEDRKEKYDEDERYEIFPAVWWEDVTEEQLQRHHFRWNAKIELRKKIVACSLSHKRLLQKIINEDLKDVFIIEDDVLIDFHRLDQLQDIKEFCYIGGNFGSPLLKDNLEFTKGGKKDSLRESLSKGINVIDPKEFRVGHTCGYYIPNRTVAQDILTNIPHGKKDLAIDAEYIFLQKKGKITKFIYPAIAKLYIPDACKGFTYSTYKLQDDQFFY